MISKIRHILTLLMLTASVVMSANMCDTTISFVNIYPGMEIYELEGHSVLRVTMPGSDFAVSYGTYDFDQPNFVYRFVKGETDYWVSAVPWQNIVYGSLANNRRVVEHVLDLTSEQKEKLLNLINENFLPENRTYRYNYVKDNCATRPFRLVELALGDSVILGQPSPEFDGEQSFRSIMRYCHRNYPWYQFGIDLALGSGIDYTLDNREKAFAPVLLDAQLDSSTVGGRPLVSSTNIIVNAEPGMGSAGPTPFWASPMFITGLFLALTIFMSVRDLKRHRTNRLFDCFIYAVFGVAGCVLAFLIFISVHEATSPNILFLWLNPLCFIPCVFMWINRFRMFVLSYQIVNFVALIALIGLSIAGVQTLNSAFYSLIAADGIRALTYIYLNIKK